MNAMTNKILLSIPMLFGLLLGCGPSCPEIKSGLDAAALLSEDSARINGMVARRKAVMEEAAQRGLDSFRLERIRFSVTAWEMAIETQARIIEASSRLADAETRGGDAGVVDDFRCYVDGLLGRTGHRITDGTGKTIRAYKVEIEGLLDRDGALTSSELRRYIEEGVEVEDEVEVDDEDSADQEEDEAEGDEDEPEADDDDFDLLDF